MLRETCEGLIGAVEYGGGLAGQVARLIMESPAPVTTMDWVADRLAMTPRTLRRRLAEQGTTFSAISDQVRSELAKKYLEAGGFSVADIGDLLGFSDTKNFRMFFRRWNNISPTGYRERISMDKNSARENPPEPFPQITS
jgi:AraC-like DNA-binding protein